MADERELVLFLAIQVDPTTGDPGESARRRGWLDEDGDLTETGRHIVAAIHEQRGTRTAPRGL